MLPQHLQLLGGKDILFVFGFDYLFDVDKLGGISCYDVHFYSQSAQIAKEALGSLADVDSFSVIKTMA